MADARRYGDHMSLEQAHGVLGHEVAFTAHGGQWVTGRLVAIAEQPQVVVEGRDGEQGHFTLHTISGWTASPAPARALPAPCPCREPNGGPPCTPERPCSYADGMPADRWLAPTDGGDGDDG